MSVLRLYAPVAVLVLFVMLASAGVSCPIGFAVVMPLAIVLHVHELHERHLSRFRRRWHH